MASWLTLDWDQEQFHLMSVQTVRRGAQVTRAVTWAHPEPFTPSTAERVGKHLRDFLKNEKIVPAPVIVGIGRDRILLKELHFPPIAAHEEAALVRFQTAKELTESVENYAIDYVHVGSGSSDGERQIMTVAGRRDIVAMLQTLCQAAGLKLHAVTPRVFGVAAALEQAVQPDASPLTANRRNVVLTLGQRWAELSFFRGERLIQAQALSKGPLLVNEVKRNIAVFLAQHAVEMDVAGPECLYVFGEDPTIVGPLQAGLNLPIVPLNPMGNGAPKVPNPGAFAGSVGLAITWGQAKNRPVNLASPKKQQPPVSVTRQRGILYGAVAAAVLVLLFGTMYYTISKKKNEIQRLVKAKQDLEDDLKKVAQDRADIEGYKEWEQTSIPWLDELYDLTARYPNKTGFRVSQLAATTNAKRNAKDGFVGQIAVTGVTPASKEDFVQQLNSSMARDAHVKPSIKRVKTGSQSGSGALVFEMEIAVAKQPASKYDTHLAPLPRAQGQIDPLAMDDEDGGDQ